MLRTPASEGFVLELAVFVKQRVCQHWVCEHIHFAGFANDFHEDMLGSDQVLDIVDGELAIRELDAAEEGLEIGTVENRNIRER